MSSVGSSRIARSGAWDLARAVLAVAVDLDHVVVAAARRRTAKPDCTAPPMPRLNGMPQHRGAGRSRDSRGRVGRAVVDDEDVEVAARASQDRSITPPDRGGLVVGGDDREIFRVEHPSSLYKRAHETAQVAAARAYIAWWRSAATRQVNRAARSRPVARSRARSVLVARRRDRARRQSTPATRDRRVARRRRRPRVSRCGPMRLPGSRTPSLRAAERRSPRRGSGRRRRRRAR